MRNIFSVLLLGATLTVCNCTDDSGGVEPVIGEWEASEYVGGEKAELEVDENLEGQATLWFYSNDTLYYSEFDVSVEPKGEGEYEFEMECDGDCSELDFTMDCDINSAKDEMYCEGDGVWSDFDFAWEKN